MKKSGLAALLLLLMSCTKVPPAAPNRIMAGYLEGDLGALTIGDPRWDGAVETPIPLKQQLIALPKSEQDGVAQIGVRAFYNGEWAAFLLAWSDPTPDRLTKIGSFSDAAAMEFPMEPGDLPDSAMGGAPGSAKPVLIHQWKAVWQEAEAGNIKGIKTFYPNTWSDVYLFEMPGTPEARAKMERTFTTSVAAENPLAHHGKAVRDLEAVGFGSVNPSEEQLSKGNGEWADGKWRVLIVRPVARLRGGLDTTRLLHAAFAVWDGAKGEVGARKMQSAWTPLEFLKPAAHASNPKGGNSRGQH